jgi:hypothetical protein
MVPHSVGDKTSIYPRLYLEHISSKDGLGDFPLPPCRHSPPRSHSRPVFLIQPTGLSPEVRNIGAQGLLDLCHKMIRAPEIYIIIKFRPYQLTIEVDGSNVKRPDRFVIDRSFLDFPTAVEIGAVRICVYQAAIGVENKAAFLECQSGAVTANAYPIDIRNTPLADDPFIIAFEDILAATGKEKKGDNNEEV